MTSGESNNSSRETESIILVRDDGFFVQGCLDEHVASLTLRSPNNYFNDGYDVQISAFFGTERVRISAEDLELSTKISIQKAEIVVDGYSSDLVYKGVASNQTSETTNTLIEEVLDSEGIDGSAIGKGSIGVEKASLSFSGVVKRAKEKQVVSKRVFESKTTRSGWDPISDRILRVFKGGQNLDGVEISGATLWRSIPRATDRPTGVAARVRVREDWITFEEPRNERGKSYFAKNVARFLTSADEKQKEYFSVLIKHLSLMGLQRAEDKLQATLATAAIIVRPESEAAVSVPTSGRISVSLAAQPISSFLDAEEGQEEATLIALGVPQHLLPAETKLIKNTARGAKDGDFLPRGSPIDAVDALRFLLGSDYVLREAFSEKFGDNTLRDLSALGLLLKSEGGRISTAEKYKDAPRILRHAASSALSMKITRTVLLANSQASVLEIADAVGFKLGRNWNNAATKKRRGNALRRWSLWLEDYLIDTEANPDAELLVAFARSTKRQVGAHSKVTPERAREARKLIKQGLSKRKVAKELNVTAATLRKILDAFDE